MFSAKLKTIFNIYSLPVAQLQRVIHKRHIDYDDAHQMFDNCAAKFPMCPDSIWSAGFLIESDASFHNQAKQFSKFSH